MIDHLRRHREAGDRVPDHAFEDLEKGPLFYRDWTRGGEDPFGGIFWYDPQWEPSHFPDPRFKQIFGHTKVAGPMRKGNHVNIHIEDGWWVFDTESEGFVRLGLRAWI
jgi:hypothetical protein